ncbi:MAG: hypothetical protein HYV09_32900 [Deltaproteobacteria bacterium]|nr:hypothetical protein [Deltaproteobacteria bacterium]
MKILRSKNLKNVTVGTRRRVSKRHCGQITRHCGAPPRHCGAPPTR